MTGKFYFRWRILILAAAVFALACNLSGGAETPPAVVEPTVDGAIATAETQPPTTASESPAPTATEAAVASTATLAAETERPTPTLETMPTLPPVTITVTLEPVQAAPGTIAPGQQTNGSLESGEIQTYNFQGTEFEPVMVFVEGADALDIAVSAYQGAVAAGADLSQATPLAQADFSPAGRPEVLVITPNEDGEHTIVVSGSGGTAGNYTLYMYNGTTAAANTRLVNDSLAAGETKNYKALSNGGRPVIVYVDQTGQSDLALQILDDNEELITEANFGGPNSAETAFVLPLEETAYTILVSTVSGETAVYNLVIVTLN